MSLERMLCHRQLSPQTLQPKGCFRCNAEGCDLDMLMTVATGIGSCATGEGFSILHHLNCHSRDVVYVIECRKCKVQGVGECADPSTRLPVYARCILGGHLESASSGCAITRHFVETEHSLNDFCFILVDCVPSNAGIHPAVIGALRRRLETFWIHRLRASLNVRRNWQISCPGGRQVAPKTLPAS
jgi:hypothetical protein